MLRRNCLGVRTWAGRVVRMGDEKLAKKADAQKGKPKLRWWRRVKKKGNR